MPRAAWISGCIAGRGSPQVTSQRLTTLIPRHADIFLWLGTLSLQRGQLAAVALQRWKARALQPDLPEVSPYAIKRMKAYLRRRKAPAFRPGIYGAWPNGPTGLSCSA